MHDDERVLTCADMSNATRCELVWSGLPRIDAQGRCENTPAYTWLQRRSIPEMSHQRGVTPFAFDSVSSVFVYFVYFVVNKYVVGWISVYVDCGTTKDTKDRKGLVAFEKAGKVSGTVSCFFRF